MDRDMYTTISPHSFTDSHQQEADTLQFVSGILLAVFHAIALILSIVILALIYVSKNLVKSNMQKMMAIYVLDQFITIASTVVFHVSESIHNTFDFSHNVCKFTLFMNGFIWSSKCPLVMMIAAFALYEASTKSCGTADRPQYLQVVVSFAAISFISTITASVMCATAVLIDNVCYTTIDRWHFVRELMIDGFLGVIPALIAVVLASVLVFRRRGKQAIQPESVIIVSSLFFIWLPAALVRIVMSFYFEVPINVLKITAIFEHVELAVTPALLLVSPTVYNRALRENMAELLRRLREGASGSIDETEEGGEENTTAV